MPDLELLRYLGEQVRPPSLDSLRETARRRDRRAAATAVGACVAAVVLVIGGGALLIGGDERTAPPPPATRSTAPTETAKPEPAVVLPLPLPKEFGRASALDAGRYNVRVKNPTRLGTPGEVLAFDMDVPEGWQVSRQQGIGPMSPPPVRPVFTPTRASGSHGRLSVVYATNAIAVQRNPCHGSGYSNFRSIDGIARGLSGISFVEVSEPVRTTVGGHNARTVTIRVRNGDDVARCHYDQYDLFWGGDTGTSYYEWVHADQAGDVIQVWITEVDGERFVFTAEVPPDAAQADLDALTGMVESISFRSSGRGRPTSVGGG